MEPLFPRLHRLSILTDRYRCRSFQIQTSEQLTGMHGWLIHFLYIRQDTPIYQRDIEKTFSIRRSTVTATLNRMEENGLIVRESVPEDARLKRIVLTEKAISLHQSVEQEQMRLEQILTDGISPEELAQFQKTLNIMCQNLETFESEGGHSTC